MQTLTWSWFHIAFVSKNFNTTDLCVVVYNCLRIFYSCSKLHNLCTMQIFHGSSPRSHVYVWDKCHKKTQPLNTFFLNILTIEFMYLTGHVYCGTHTMLNHAYYRRVTYFAVTILPHYMLTTVWRHGACRCVGQTESIAAVCWMVTSSGRCNICKLTMFCRIQSVVTPVMFLIL